jgi:hypothetical protein
MRKHTVLAMIATVAFKGTIGWAECFDHKIWDNILKTNVDGDGYVNYDAIKINKGGDLYQYLSFVEAADLKTCTDKEKLAFWINTYNATMIAKVLARPNMKKVSEDFKLFAEPCKVAKIQLSLNEIEHRVLRSDPKNGGPIAGVSLTPDPRIHFALVCGAMDCPKLWNRAYSPQNVDERLQANAVSFANNPKHLRIENGQLVMTSLMKWYMDDFKSVGGVAAYLATLTDAKLRPDAELINQKLATDFPDKVMFHYDWTLNTVKNRPKAPDQAVKN